MPFIKIRFHNETQHIDQGTFSGDLKKAEEAIQAFVDRNTFIYEGYGDYDGVLTIREGRRETSYGISPYGIDIPMMLRFCHLNPKDFNDFSPSPPEPEGWVQLDVPLAQGKVTFVEYVNGYIRTVKAVNGQGQHRSIFVSPEGDTYATPEVREITIADARKSNPKGGYFAAQMFLSLGCIDTAAREVIKRTQASSAAPSPSFSPPSTFFGKSSTSPEPKLHGSVLLNFPLEQGRVIKVEYENDRIRTIEAVNREDQPRAIRISLERGTYDTPQLQGLTRENACQHNPEGGFFAAKMFLNLGSIDKAAREAVRTQARSSDPSSAFTRR